MALDITNNSKNNLSITNEEKPSGGTWAEHTETWEDTGGHTWANPGLPVTKESKNNLSISNEAKN